MTRAYLEGFCKTAETCGVNPYELMKAARFTLSGKVVAPIADSLYKISPTVGRVLSNGAANIIKGVNKLNPFRKPPPPPKVVLLEDLPISALEDFKPFEGLN